MNKYIAMIVLVFLAGCGMDNDEIIKETKKCESAGMRAHVAHDGWGGRYLRCYPKVQTDE